MSTPHVLERQVFATSRLLEFCSKKELVLQTGHSVEQWPLVILKELLDNALDACEEANVQPQISVIVGLDPPFIAVRDNGPGIASVTVKSLLDFSVRVSSREAYVSPTRGAQGNALKTLVAMPFALDGTIGTTTIEAHGTRHKIDFTVDNLRQEPRVHLSEEPSNVKSGTRFMVHWPDSSRSQIEESEDRFLQIAEGYTWLNPHLSLRVAWGDREVFPSTDPAWSKWRPSDPTPGHWYDIERFERLIAAYVADDQDRGRTRTVREFAAEFRGMSASAKQKVVLDKSGLARTALADLFTDGVANREFVTKLLEAVQDNTKPIKPQELGIIGRDHFAAKFAAAGADPESFSYKKTLRDDDDNPAVIETAFRYCPNERPVRRIITGVNWSVGINNPYRSLGYYGKSLDGILQDLRAGREEPIIVVVHLACPRIAYTDRGKGSLVLS